MWGAEEVDRSARSGMRSHCCTNLVRKEIEDMRPCLSKSLLCALAQGVNLNEST